MSTLLIAFFSLLSESHFYFLAFLLIKRIKTMTSCTNNGKSDNRPIINHIHQSKLEHLKKLLTPGTRTTNSCNENPKAKAIHNNLLRVLKL